MDIVDGCFVWECCTGTNCIVLMCFKNEKCADLRKHLGLTLAS